MGMERRARILRRFATVRDQIMLDGRPKDLTYNNMKARFRSTPKGKKAAFIARMKAETALWLPK